MLLQTLITDVNIDDILTVLAYIDARSGIDNTVLTDALEILTEDKGSWDLEALQQQVEERSAVLQGTL